MIDPSEPAGRWQPDDDARLLRASLALVEDRAGGDADTGLVAVHHHPVTTHPEYSPQRRSPAPGTAPGTARSGAVPRPRHMARYRCPVPCPADNPPDPPGPSMSLGVSVSEEQRRFVMDQYHLYGMLHIRVAA